MFYLCSATENCVFFFIHFSKFEASNDRKILIEMDSSHSLILNEEAFKQIPDHKKPVYVFEWLRYLDKGLIAAQKVS